MRVSLEALRNSTFTYSRADLVAVALIAALVSVWSGVAGGSFSLLALLALEATFFAFYLTGSLFASIAPLATGVLFDVPLRLLVGYAVVNTTLLLLAVVSPLGMVANFGIVVAAVLLAFSRIRKRRHEQGDTTTFWAIGICAVATTLWCRDSIDPILHGERIVVFKPWVDGFYHAVHIRIFAESHGASSIEDFRMAGVPARLYHYGCYMLPAFVKQAAGIHSYTAFAGILAPVGVLFTGLAAYGFFGSIWGSRPGLAACAALLLLPDGAQQGMQNPFMSYHWLTQISPSATYGLALLAVAWLFVIRGCQRGSKLQLAAGWCVAGLLVVYKLHYVVASALLLLLVPAVFFQAGSSARRRAGWIAAACTFYVVALMVGQRVPGVPLIRFDGSAHGEILRLIHSFAIPGRFKDFLVQHMGAQFPWTSNLLFGIPYVLLATLGIFLPLLVFLALRLRKRTPLLCVLFPFLLVANFLAMFFGLALDFASSTPDELSHRPVMIVYFFAVAWIGGALGLMVVEAKHLSRVARPVIIGLATLLLVVPASLSQGVQLMWVMPKISPVRLPKALLDVAEHIRTHGSPRDIFQDSQFDRIYAIAALSERRAFVSHTLTHMPFRGKTVATRSAAVDRIMAMRQAKLVLGTARAYGLRWFVVQRGNEVRWPSELDDKKVLEKGPFTLYDLE